MKLRAIVKRSIDNQEPGQLFRVRDIAPRGAAPMDISKSLSLYYRRGLISKLTKGIYFKPRISSITGNKIPPKFDDVVRKLKEVQGATVWYVTGVSAYGNLALTTQMSTVMSIATDKPRSPVQFAGMTLNFVKSCIPIPVEWPKFAQMLDALKDIKKIPDAVPKETCARIASILKGLSSFELNILVQYAGYYPPRVRALLGFCLDIAEQRDAAERVKATLSAETPKYSIGMDSRSFSTSLHWNIR